MFFAGKNNCAHAMPNSCFCRYIGNSVTWVKEWSRKERTTDRAMLWVMEEYKPPTNQHLSSITYSIYSGEMLPMQRLLWCNYSCSFPTSPRSFSLVAKGASCLLLQSTKRRAPRYTLVLSALSQAHGSRGLKTGVASRPIVHPQSIAQATHPSRMFLVVEAV